jgi:hypothetical protein
MANKKQKSAEAELYRRFTTLIVLLGVLVAIIVVIDYGKSIKVNDDKFQAYLTKICEPYCNGSCSEYVVSNDGAYAKAVTRYTIGCTVDGIIVKNVEVPVNAWRHTQ